MEENKNKEEFCPVCVSSVPLAFSSTADGNSDDDEKYKISKKYSFYWKKWILSTLIIIAILSIIMILYGM
jgi:hypothetical protein